MTDSVRHMVPDEEKRVPLRIAWRDYLWPLLFLLSMTMMGLKFPLGYIFVPMILISSFRRDRYDFLIMLTIFFGGYGLIGEGTMPIKPWDIGFVVSFIGVIILKKSLIVKKTLALIVVYAALLIFIATFSEERMMIQIRTIRNYLFFIYFIVPLMVFAGQEFDIKIFFRRLFPYVIILLWFYVIDGYIINGHVMLPVTFFLGERTSVFYSPVTYGLGNFPRVYPPGLFIAVLVIYPLARLYSIRGWQLILTLLAFGVTRTFTVITGFIAEYVFSMPNVKKILGIGAAALAFVIALYFIDSVLPKNSENNESSLRIYSSVQQLISLDAVQDDEDLAELGSGRIGQALPKFELVDELGKRTFGLGFLHSELTTNTKYIISNPFYHDLEKAEEVATGIEVEPLQVYLSAGYVGLIVHFGFLFLTWFMIRRCRYSFYYLTVLFGLFWFGLGGFAGLNTSDGLFLASLAYGVVLLNWRSKENVITV